MLSEKEETRLQGLAEKVAFCKEDLQYPRLNTYDIEWLVTRLKEVNDECSKISAELQKANEELARVYKEYGPYIRSTDHELRCDREA